MKVTIEEYAKRFKMSVEMVKVKVRYGRLPSMTDNGITWIELSSSTPNLPTPAPGASLETAMALLQSCRHENLELKTKIAALEAKIDALIDDKEQMLKDERDRIENIYATRDEQLKNFLEVVNTRLLQSVPASMVTDTTTVEEGNSNVQDTRKPVELLRYLHLLDLPDDVRKKIVKRFARSYGSDVRIIQQNGAFYLDFSKYDYSDLLRH